MRRQNISKLLIFQFTLSKTPSFIYSFIHAFDTPSIPSSIIHSVVGLGSSGFQRHFHLPLLQPLLCFLKPFFIYSSTFLLTPNSEKEGLLEFDIVNQSLHNCCTPAVHHSCVPFCEISPICMKAANSWNHHLSVPLICCYPDPSFRL